MEAQDGWNSCSEGLIMLDINTTSGVQWKIDEALAIKLYNKHFPDIIYAETDKTTAARVDAVLVKNSNIIGIAETKCRYNITLLDFETKFNNEWILSFKKLMDCRAISDLLICPLYGFLYIVKDNVLMIKKIYDPTTRRWTCKFRVENTETSGGPNDTKITRSNAFIKMDGRTLLKEESNAVLINNAHA
jgi:hypothetical protein